MISFNLSSGHCKLLQRVWKELRNDKLKQVERPVLWSISQSPEQLSNAPYTSLGLVCTWNDPVQQQLYHIVLSFVDNAVSELRSRRFRADLHRHCRRFGRQMAAVFRGAVDVDQALSWEMLGQSVMENLHAPFRSNAAKLFIWQLFLEHLSSMVLEAFCWSVARDFTSRPLPTIYESDPKDCFLQAKNAPPKPTVLQRILSKLVRRQLHLVASPSAGKRTDHALEVQAWEQRRLAHGLSGPANIVPRNAETYRAIFSYKPEHPDELELTENDIVFVVEKCDDGWYIGTLLRTGQYGTFPGNFVVKH